MTLAKMMPQIKVMIGVALILSFLFPYQKPLMFQFYAAVFSFSAFHKVEPKSTTPPTFICPTKHGEIANCLKDD